MHNINEQQGSSTRDDDLRAEFDFPPADLRLGSPSAIFEFAASVFDVFRVAGGWHGGMLGDGMVEWYPCDPKRPEEIHPACVRFVDRRKIKRGQTLVCAALRLGDAGVVEIRIGKQIERFSNLLALLARVIALAGDGYGKLARPPLMSDVALRIAARQAEQPTDDAHLKLFEALIVMRHALDALRAELLADPAFEGTECRSWAEEGAR